VSDDGSRILVRIDTECASRWTHSVRWQSHDHATSSGHVYQNRFKAFPVETIDHLDTVLCYMKRDPQRTGLVERPGQ